jgi:hypothetical protein
MQNLNDKDISSTIVDSEDITNNPSETESDSALLLSTTLNTDFDFKNTDSTEEPLIPDISFPDSYQPTVVTPQTSVMTVTTKTATASTTALISRQPDKKFKSGFLSNLLHNNGSSHSVSSVSSGTDVSKKKSSSTEAGSRYKLFKSWSNTQDNEYKSIEKALARYDN